MAPGLRTSIPTSASQLEPSVNTQVTPQLKKRRKQQQTPYDKSAMPLTQWRSQGLPGRYIFFRS